MQVNKLIVCDSEMQLPVEDSDILNWSSYFSIEKENPNLILGREQIGIQYTIMADDATQMF